jgi:hypothetical protein
MCMMWRVATKQPRSLRKAEVRSEIAVVRGDATPASRTVVKQAVKRYVNAVIEVMP